MSLFSARLKELRKDRRLYQKEMAEYLQMSVRGYQAYETGQNEPNIRTLIALADYFGVSIDYLVGRTDERNESR